MNVAKKLALAILSPLFIILLFSTAFDVGFIRTATHPTTVKKLAAESGIYDSVVPSLLQQTKSINTSVGSIDTSNPLVQKAANSTITPQFVQQNTEAAIDSIYRWLDGGVSQPDFKIDLSQAKTGFADNVAASVRRQLTGLPVCQTAAQSQSFNPLDAKCLPSGVSPATAAADVKKSLVANQDFLDQTSLSAVDIKNKGSDKSVFQDQLKSVPKQYQRAKKTPIILSVLTILVGGAIVLLSSSWQKGLRHIGINLVVIGVIMLIFSYGLNRAVSTKIAPKIKLDNAVLQTDVRNLVTDLARQIDKNYWFFGCLYSALGAAAIGTEIYMGRGAKSKTAAEPPAPTAGSTRSS